MSNLESDNHNALSQHLLAWAPAHLRPLPWRREPRDPYWVWISEIMLQQTQVATVVPYFDNFLARFPAVGMLAAAPLQDVLKAWEGLGYYSRARNLHRAAQAIVTCYDGQLPRTVEALMTLPGIGRYTAGAIASLAFGVPAPVLDGNVKRVLCRLFAIEDDLRLPATEKKLWALAERLVPTRQAGLFNEALMELGATVCTPRAPDCARCPLAAHCQARAQGKAEALPLKSARKPLPHYDVTAAVICKQDKLLVAQRPLDKMLGGLWEFPGGKCQTGESLPACLQREIKEELNIEIVVGEHLATIKHTYTHLRITLHAFICRHLTGQIQALGVADWRWMTLDELDELAFPVTDQKIIAALKARGTHCA